MRPAVSYDVRDGQQQETIGFVKPDDEHPYQWRRGNGREVERSPRFFSREL